MNDEQGIIFLAAHMLACFWFLIGSNDQITVELNTTTREPAICSAERAASEAVDALLDRPACIEGQQIPHTVLGWVAVLASEHEWWGDGGLKVRFAISGHFSPTFSRLCGSLSRCKFRLSWGRATARACT